MNEHVFAAIDIGTNSIRLAVVRVDENQRLHTLSQHREMVRLGEGEFKAGKMTPEAIERGALVCARFADVARGFGASEIVAFATSAVREAENRDDFIERVRQQAAIEVRVISGAEEARLIWFGVISGVELNGKKAVLIDIGGGSTEVIVGSAVNEYSVLESMKLGALRLTSKFFDTTLAIPEDQLLRSMEYIHGVANQVVRKVRAEGFDLAFGSAGSINSLGEVIARVHTEGAGRQQNVIRTVDLHETIGMLCSLSLEQRRNVPGLDPMRADIILGGGAVLLSLMEAMGIERLMTSDRGLRDGILLDHVLRGEGTLEKFQSVSVRRRSILQLAHSCKYEAEHANHTAFLALRMFDELKCLGAHTYGATSRELLEYAALVHDIGTFLSHSNHQKHAYYLVRYSDLLGFDDTEIDVIANVALYHRKGLPKKSHSNLAELNRSQRRRVSVLAAILRVAEGLDRSHLGLVQDIRLELAGGPSRFVLTIVHTGDCALERWGVQNNSDLFEDVFAAPLEVHTEHATN